ncbi:hypothetical protein AV530_012355 [Patagioenas fasciata monilis]|uniref:Uncharacterized protein n=1 Tax=Patagioenas fasciata monilis TaxID=372326 RepID=A0A1V4JAK4_PATFA|nr:hypothetical protein AV530_012355 [Patagioenas fasciata monilis]
MPITEKRFPSEVDFIKMCTTLCCLLVGVLGWPLDRRLIQQENSMITAKIPGQLGFPIRACCVIIAIHLFHVASAA